jgi:multidrug efflux system membrane fusion protein
MDDSPRTTARTRALERNLLDRTRPSPPTRTGMSRKSRVIAGLVVVIVIGFGINHWLHRPPAPQVGNRAPVQSPAQPVGVAPVTNGNIRITINALGTVTPIATVTVVTQINGQLIEVGFNEGQHVKKGDFLAQIDPRPYETAKEQAEGQLMRDRGLLDQARMDLARYESLAKTQAIPRQTAEDQVYIVAQYEGAVKSDQAQVDTQKLNLIYCRIVSPVDGRVGLRLVDPGNYVQTLAATSIAVITQMQPMTVIFGVPEDHLPAILAKIRAAKSLTAKAYDRGNLEELATGHVGALDSQIDTTTGMVKLRAEFPNDDEALFPNQFVNVRLLVDELHDVVVAPLAAIQRGAPGTYVYLINADDTVSVRPIKLGPTDAETGQVVSGLAVGDRVVVDGADRLRDGARIKIPNRGGDGRAQSDRPAGSHQRDSESGPARGVNSQPSTR